MRISDICVRRPVFATVMSLLLMVIGVMAFSRLTLRELLYDFGGGSASGRPVKAAQVGGPLGAYVPHWNFDMPFGYEELGAKDALLGHAGITVFDDSADMLAQARFAMEFCAIESCGKCTPCREGTYWMRQIMLRLEAGRGLPGDVDGMVHMSDIAWGVSGEDALQLHRKGERVEAQVLDVDVEKERISLGIKQLQADPAAEVLDARIAARLNQ